MHVALVALLLMAQEASPKPDKPWEQKVALPVPVPMELPAVPPTNPFFTPLVAPPAPRQMPMREDFAVTVPVAFAVYVDKNGSCRRAQPLGNPLPGVVEPVRLALQETSFTPAKAFGQPVGVWVDVGVDLQGEISTGRLTQPVVTLPDPAEPATPESPALPPAEPRDSQLAGTPLAQLSSFPAPKRFSAKAPAQEFRQPIKLILELAPEGKVKRLVFLSCPEGLRPWVLASAAGWTFSPPQATVGPTTAWVVLAGVLEVQVKTLRAEGLRVSRTSSYPAK
ncbi:MAG: hypothetical protein NZ869_11225 [Thermoanaerobaculum sp.]|nr:hypothetical protein [Thermoanaerobaculum sp.]